MPNQPLGISFSPFGQQQNQSGGQGGQSGAPAPSPQSAIQMLSFRTPRTVGANSPIPGPLLNAPGGAAFGGQQFGAAGGNLEQLLQLIFGRMKGGISGLPGTPQASLFGGGGAMAQPMPWEQPTSAPPSPNFTPGGGGETPQRGPGETTYPGTEPGFDPGATGDRSNPAPRSGGDAGPSMAPTGGDLPWLGSNFARPGRGGF
jgi:hypothetical protein